MHRPPPLYRIRKFLVVFAGLVFLVGCSSFIYAQTGSKPLSICELLQNKKKYKGKEVLIEGIIDVGSETATFRYEKNCPVAESIVVGTHKSFRSDVFERATNLLSLQREGEKKLGVSLNWGVFLRVKVRVKGILQTSDKPKFGHLNSYKNLFLITDTEEVGQSQLILVKDIFSDDPGVIVTREND